MSENKQKTYTEIKWEFSQELEELRNAGKNRLELAFLHSPNTHRLLNKLNYFQSLLEDNKEKEVVIEFFEPNVQTLRRVRVKMLNGEVKAKREHHSIKKGTPLRVILDNFLFRQNITDQSYLESNAILRKLTSVEQITSLAMRMSAEKEAMRQQRVYWSKRLGKKKKAVKKE